MRLYTLFSFIIYLMLAPFIYRSISIYLNIYSIEFYSINFWIYLTPLILKLGLDIVYFIKKDKREILTRVNSIFFISIIIIIFSTIPKTQVEIQYRNSIIQKLLTINDSLFKYYNLEANKLPPDFIVNNIIKNENDKSPFLKNGKTLNHKIFLWEKGSDISTQEPGTVLLIIDNEEQQYYLSMIVWNYIKNRKELFSINGEEVIIGSKSSIQNIKVEKQKREEQLKILKEQALKERG
ncbi:hypothetical protein JXR93_14280 [bacterium]|nr:hypothetical protein [bacterium]